MRKYNKVLNIRARKFLFLRDKEFFSDEYFFIFRTSTEKCKVPFPKPQEYLSLDKMFFFCSILENSFGGWFFFYFKLGLNKEEFHSQKHKKSFFSKKYEKFFQACFFRKKDWGGIFEGSRRKVRWVAPWHATNLILINYEKFLKALLHCTAQ